MNKFSTIILAGAIAGLSSCSTVNEGSKVSKPTSIPDYAQIAYEETSVETPLASLESTNPEEITILEKLKVYKTQLREAPVTEELKTQMIQESMDYLQNSNNLEAIGFAGEILERLASENEVPLLQNALFVPQTSEAARRALTAIDGNSATEALIQGLTASDPRIVAGCIDSLAERGDQVAAYYIDKLLLVSNSDVKREAIKALGELGGNTAVAALYESYAQELSEQLRTEIEIALLNSVDKDPPQARTKTLNFLISSSDRPFLRSSAFRKLTVIPGERSEQLLLANLGDPEAEFHDTAITVISEIDSPGVLKAASGFFPQLPESSTLKLMEALQVTRSQSVEPAFIDALNDEREAVSSKAVTGLADVGGLSSLNPLMAYLKKNGRSASKDVLESASSLRGQDVNSAVERVLSDIAAGKVTSPALPGIEIDDQVTSLFIDIASKRNLNSAEPSLLALAASDDRGISRDAISALSSLGTESSLSPVLELLEKASATSVRRSLEDTFLQIARRTDEATANTLAIGMYSNSNDSEFRQSLLQILGSLGVKESFPLLKETALSGSDSEEKKAAIRALSLWPGQDASSLLFEIAEESSGANRSLALRGYITSVDYFEETSEKLSMYKKAAPMIANDAESRLLISGLGKTGGKEAVVEIATYLDSESIKEEAALAIAQSFENSKDLAGDEDLKPILMKAIDSASTTELKERLGKYVSVFTESQHLLVWDISGPYTLEGVFDQQFLLDNKFPAEEKEGGDWRTIRGGSNPNAPEVIDFLHLIGGQQDYAVMYARTWIRSPNPHDAVLHIGSDDGVKVWLNGEVVHENNINRAPIPGDDKVPVKIQRGTNELTIKVVQVKHGWGFCAALAPADGEVMKDLLVKGQGMYMVPMEILGQEAVAMEEEIPVWSTERWTGDLFTGEYAGEYIKTDDSKEARVAQVWATKTDEFKVTVQNEFNAPYNPLITLTGKKEEDVVHVEGEGWKGQVTPDHLYIKNEETDEKVVLDRVDRQSPTLGLEPPEDALVLFDGSDFNQWVGAADGTVTWDLLPNGVAQVKPKTGGIITKQPFKDVQLHLEFRSPYSPGNEHQFYGNSGIFLQIAYEVQVLQSFGLEGLNNECGAIYDQFPPLVNACAPPLEWQTYDIEFYAARFDDSGNMTKPARITVVHNGVTVQDNRELPKTSIPDKAPPSEAAPLYIQDHHNQVQFRNIWIKEIKSTDQS